MIWSDEEVLEFISAEFLILRWTGDLIELYFDFVIWLGFISYKTIISWFHKVIGFHFLEGKSCIKREYTVMELSTKIIRVSLGSFDVDVKRTWVFDFNEVLKLGVSVERWCKLELIIKESLIIESVADLSLRFIAFFKCQQNISFIFDIKDEINWLVISQWERIIHFIR